MNSKYNYWEIVARILDYISKLPNLDPMTSFITPTYFDSFKIPKISLYDYVARINKYAHCSESCFIIAFIYIDRILKNDPSIILTIKNVHRLILMSIIIAIKYLDDVYYDNETYSKIGGITLMEINSLENEFLNKIQYDLYVSDDLFFQYAAEIELQFQKLIEKELKFEMMIKDTIKQFSNSIRGIESMDTIFKEN